MDWSQLVSCLPTPEGMQKATLVVVFAGENNEVAISLRQGVEETIVQYKRTGPHSPGSQELWSEITNALGYRFRMLDTEDVVVREWHIPL